MTANKQPTGNPLTLVRGALLTGTAVIAVTFFGFGGWAATAPLASASVAQGVVAVHSRRQTIQHLEGGIIAELPVRDGDLVKAGDLLVRLDDTKARASYELLRGQYFAALGEKSRLEAERDGLDQIQWDDELLAEQNAADIKNIMRGQSNVFQSRKEYVAGQDVIIRERQLQSGQEIEALEAQLKAETRKLSLIQEELTGVEELFAKGLEKRPRLLSLQRASAEIEGTRGQLAARIARAKQTISELAAQQSDLKNRMMTEVVGQLRDVEGKIADLGQRLRAGKDVLDRVEIRAPRDGYIVNMAYHTVGGVIEPSKPILDLVPYDDTLVVEARFEPRDIDVLKVGLPAEITLTPYSTRTVPPVAGRLVLVSADSLVDQKTGLAYYAGRVEVDQDELHHLKDVKLVPGMPAQVMVRTGERTALDYLIDPFQKSIHRAFREK
ncbi:HlyD family type I secretion periplasmic adaptor subunit [Microvirga sp. GCM10011540]|uniref:HlyD family type I secretion periplasmic adaptor subunit n=1 Tax=Microvirga sp. GCM10011540 TaxID=3317338 RepID=UPI003616E679